MTWTEMKALTPREQKLKSPAEAQRGPMGNNSEESPFTSASRKKEVVTLRFNRRELRGVSSNPQGEGTTLEKLRRPHDGDVSHEKSGTLTDAAMSVL